MGPSEPADDPGGCGVGDRAEDDGLCPAGEVCSDVTPLGLLFSGPGLTDETDTYPATTAVGGTQPLELAEPVPGGDPIPLDANFGVQFSTAGVLTYEDQTRSSVTVRGVAPGVTFLRLTEPATNALLDRYLLVVETLDVIEPIATQPERIVADRPRAFLAGASPIGLALRAANGVRLVDTSLVASEAGVPVATLAWDELDLGDVPPGTKTIDVVAAGEAFAVDITWVDSAAVTVLEMDPPEAILAEPDQPLYAGDLLEVCARALASDAQVLGLTWEFEAIGATASPAGPLVGPNLGDHNCAWITTAAEPGVVTITARTLGLSVETSVELLPAPEGRSRRPALPPAPAPRGLGARAAAIWQ